MWGDNIGGQKRLLTPPGAFSDLFMDGPHMFLYHKVVCGDTFSLEVVSLDRPSLPHPHFQDKARPVLEWAVKDGRSRTCSLEEVVSYRLKMSGMMS